MCVLASTVDDWLLTASRPQFFNKFLTCDVKIVHVLVLKLSDLTTCTVQIQSQTLTCFQNLFRLLFSKMIHILFAMVLAH